MTLLKEIIRNVLKNTALKNVSVRRKLPRPFGNTYVWVTPAARLKFLKPGKSVFKTDYSGLMFVADRLVEKNDNVWDIGANVGIFTFAAATKVGHLGEVVSVEADTLLVQLLRKSERTNFAQESNVSILPAAISSDNKLSRFQISGTGRNTNTLDDGGMSATDDIVGDLIVPTYTLDTLYQYFNSPDVIKIDVEGAEYKVLEGAHNIITNTKPKIYCEVRQKNVNQVTELLKGYGYGLYKIEGGGIEPIDQCTFNTLALPKEPDG
jgi:FkbM family methyltransferase